MPSQDQLIACIEKNRLEEIRITLCRFKGVDLVDVRTFVNFSGTPEEDHKATKKGISLKIEPLPELIEALQDALAQARAAACSMPIGRWRHDQDGRRHP
jgi:hypothetical protein